MNKIEEAFVKEGYVSIPFSFNGAGHPMITVTLDRNVQANFLLDTGASINLLDYEFADELKIGLTPTGGKAGGASGLIHDLFSVDEISLEISGKHFNFDNFYSMDFTSIKQALTENGVLEEVHGMLGVDFFKMTKCFIDYSDNRIFILNNKVTSL